jgi:hypothetical protein
MTSFLKTFDADFSSLLARITWPGGIHARSFAKKISKI